MVNKIIKRDGRVVEFEADKIYFAVKKASQAAKEEILIGGVVDETVRLVNETYKNDTPTVENIQDIVEKVLIAKGYAGVAKAYIIYRSERTKVREAKSRFMKKLNDITFVDSKDNDGKRENANVDGDTAMGTMLQYGSESAKDFYLTCLIDKKFSKPHLEGDIHIHDLDFYSLTLTCCQMDLIKLFEGGFSTGHGFVREPNSIRTYSALACIAIQANQNDQHGGQSVPNFDFVMAMGVRKSYNKIFINNLFKFLNYDDEKITKEDVKKVVGLIKEENNLIPSLGKSEFEKVLKPKLVQIYNIKAVDKLIASVVKNSELEIKDETYQAMEALVHNLNTMHSRAGAQVPFSSLNYGTDTSNEGRLVLHCLLDVTMKGLGNGETAIFPIQIFKVKEGINYNKEDINYDLFIKAIETSALRLFPNFSFLDAPYNLQYYKEGDSKSEVAYMGCRTRVMANVYNKDNEVTTGRGNLSFTSINLPRLAMKTKDIEKFYIELDKTLALVFDQLLERLEIQGRKKVYNFPFLMGQGLWIDSDKLAYDDYVKDVIKNGTLSVGFIGLAETLIALIGKHHGESKKAQKLGLEIIEFMKKRVDEAALKHKLNFTLLATPAEGLSGRFVELDKKMFGVVKGITDKDFYTNSFHIPVYYNISMFKKIDLEAPYHVLTNAGHITYVEVDGDISKNIPVFEKIIRHMKETGVGYGSVNHPLDRDSICGFNGVINDVCPKCNRVEGDVPFERIRRITGYLVGTLDRFNNAKRKEVESRVLHSNDCDEN